MWMFINRRNGKVWETAQTVITNNDFIEHLELQEGDKVGCYYMHRGRYRRDRESLCFSEGKVQMAGPCVRTAGQASRQAQAVGAQTVGA